jgi:hypothetical protein
MTPITKAKSAGSYVSQNVFDGKRSLTPTHTSYLREIADQHARRPSGKAPTARSSRSKQKQKPV